MLHTLLYRSVAIHPFPHPTDLDKYGEPLPLKVVPAEGRRRAIVWEITDTGLEALSRSEVPA